MLIINILYYANRCWVILVILVFIWARCYGGIILIVVIPKMKSESRQKGQAGCQSTEVHLRRSSRERREPKHDDYFMGTLPLDQLLGYAPFEEDCHPKRRRKNYRYDDSDDYSDGPKSYRKQRPTELNKVEGLLEWRQRLEMLPITIEQQPGQKQVPLEHLNRVKLSRNLAGENLQLLGQEVQAIFVNIDWGKKGQTMQDFRQLKLESSRLMSKGLVFVWAPKQSVSELLEVMEEKGFLYVQNFQVINFDIEKAKAHSHAFRKRNSSNSEEKREDSTQNEEIDINSLIKSLDNANPADLIAAEESSYFNVSKRTLLMFKKNSSLRFQLRHQRTCDVVFDLPLRLGQKCGADLKAYIYNMIQTLLPQCLTVIQKGKEGFGFRMMELWADRDQYRRGWISVVQE